MKLDEDTLQLLLALASPGFTAGRGLKRDAGHLADQTLTSIARFHGRARIETTTHAHISSIRGRIARFHGRARIETGKG